MTFKTAKTINITYIALISSIISVALGTITAFLVSHFLSSKELGIYFTINSILILRVIIDSGYTSAIVSVVATNKGFKNLSLVYNLSTKRFQSASIFAFFFLTTFFTFFFFDYLNNIGIVYLLTLSTLVSINIYLMPKLAIIEGLGYLEELYIYRIFTNLVSYILSWFVLIMGLGLLNIIIYQTMIMIITILFTKKQLNIKEQFEHTPNDYKVMSSSFKNFTNKITLSWICSFSLNNGMVPFTFKFFSPELSGQLGLVRSLLAAISMLSREFIMVKRPLLGRYFSKKKYKDLFSTFCIAFLGSFFSYAALTIIISCILFIFDPFQIKSKILPFDEYLLFAVLTLIVNLIGWLSYFFRAQKREVTHIGSLLVLISTILFILLGNESISLRFLFQFLIYSNLIFILFYQLYNIRKFLGRHSLIFSEFFISYFNYIRNTFRNSYNHPK